MASTKRHDRQRANLLINKILGSRDEYNYPSFTLLLDTVSQSAKSVIRSIVHRAKHSSGKVIFLNFETHQRRSKEVYDLKDGEDEIILAYTQSVEAWQAQVKAAISRIKKGSKAILLIDSLNEFCHAAGPKVPQFLLSWASPSLRIVGVYHTDVQLHESSNPNPYMVSALATLKYISTTTFTCRSLFQTLEELEAQAYSRAKPAFGLDEGVEGVLQSLGSDKTEGMVVEMEHKRKSGNIVSEIYVFPRRSTNDQGKIVTLNEYLETNQVSFKTTASEVAKADDADVGGTMNLGLTEQQRQDREGVVLPHFDAQKGEGGEGGRILYDMGAEDDFDEEEDEI
nr:hypothetical protein B0A51_06531 [Rachicladosporium sp. CCFEE 5018]